MLRLLVDQNLDHDIVRGLIRRIPQLDAVMAFDIGMSEASDLELLTWAAQAGRIILTHDRKTMPTQAADLLSHGEHAAGVVIVPRRMPMRHVIDELEMIITCSENEEWVDVIRYLPL